MALRSLAALALLDPDQHAGAVDVVDLEGGHLRDAQARAVGGAERRLVLQPRRRFEQPADLRDAEHVRELAGLAHQDEATRQVRPVEGDGEEEAQRRHGSVDGGRLDASLGLMDLEAADVLGRRAVGRAFEEGGEASDAADVVALGLLPQAAQAHVVEHALAQRANG